MILEEFCLLISHYSRFGVFLSKIGMHVKTVKIEFFANSWKKLSAKTAMLEMLFLQNAGNSSRIKKNIYILDEFPEKY